MKIWQVVPYYPPHVGGMEYYVERLSEGLAARGHDVTVFTSSNNRNQEVYTRNKVKIRTLKIMTKIYNNPISPTLFTQLMTEEKPDIIHTHQYPIFYSDIAGITSWAKKIPLILHVHVISEAKSALSGLISDTYYSTIGLLNLKKANSIIVPSQVYKNKINKLHVLSDKLKVVPYGIDIKRFQDSSGIEAFKLKYRLEGSKVILSVGRLNYQKGLKYLIQAMPLVLKKINNAKLLIVGEGEQLFNLKKLVKNLGLSKMVIFTGALEQEIIPAAYGACDVFVLPSLFESFGISLIEAQTAGKPVIGTRSGGTYEALIDTRTGLLIEPKSSIQLANAIVKILSDENKARLMGEKGKEFVKKKFSIEVNLDSIINLYSAFEKAQ